MDCSYTYMNVKKTPTADEIRKRPPILVTVAFKRQTVQKIAQEDASRRCAPTYVHNDLSHHSLYGQRTPLHIAPAHPARERQEQ